MLQQILRDMWIDPALLEQLEEEQKQQLFCQMREEQVRRWKVWDEKVGTSKSPKPPKKALKKVDFLLGADGKPWVWVMGEHPDDKTIEDILEEEAKEKAKQLAEKEMIDSKILSEIIDYSQPTIKHIGDQKKPEVVVPLEDHFDLYCSIDSIKGTINSLNSNKKKTVGNYSFNHYENKNHSLNVVTAKNAINELLEAKTPQKVSQKVAMWERRVMEERTTEIMKNLKKKRLEAAKEAEEAEKKQEEIWREQERKAKEAEQQIREIARRARGTVHRLASTETETKAQPADPPSLKPTGRQSVVQWYRRIEAPKGSGLDAEGHPEAWFYGLISRLQAEAVLADQSIGTFLVRLSERIWGYAITYKAAEKCKHYLVEATNGQYQFLGDNQTTHKSLRALIAHHHNEPLSGGEKLVKACPRLKESEDLKELTENIA